MQFSGVLLGFIDRARSAAALRASAALRTLARDERGATAVEFAFISGALVILLLNGIDIGRYAYLREQVEKAAQAGAHAIWLQCDTLELPVLSKCADEAKPASNWKPAATSAIFRTLLGKDTDAANDAVTLGSLVEGYFCPTSAGTLVAVANPSSPPGTCLAGTTPGIYVQLQVTYAYTPIFGDLSVSRLFGTSISKTSHMRMQ
ncbi:MAG TPA: TadE family protein [Microvirga sp.]|nr:TadE family protein [Microvirga sp.]